MKKLNDLRPCPFCGKPMSVDNFFSCDGYPQACGCWEKTHSGEKAMEIWNTRPLEDALQAEVERLVDKNRTLRKKNSELRDELSDLRDF